MVMLGATELAHLRRFVKEVLTICEADVEGMVSDLYDPAIQAAEILGVVWERDDEDFTI